MTCGLDKHVPLFRIPCHACRLLFVHCEIKWWKKKNQEGKTHMLYSSNATRNLHENRLQKGTKKMKIIKDEVIFVDVRKGNRSEFQWTPKIGLLKIKNWLFHREFTRYDPYCPTFASLSDHTHMQRMTSNKIRRRINSDHNKQQGTNYKKSPLV